MWEWNDFWKKDLLIQSESFTHDGRIRRRPTAVVGLVRLTGAARSAANAAPLAYNYGIGQDEARLFDTEAGHVMGLRLGGLNISENVVPMYAHVNRDLFRAVERDIEAAYEQGERMGIEYVLRYDGADPRVPSSIAVRLLTNMQFPDGTRYTFDLPARFSTTVMQAVPVANRIAVDPQIALLFQQAREAVAKGWTVEKYSSDFAEWVRQGGLPPVDQRPYAFLDYIHFELNGSGALSMDEVGTIGKGWMFSEAQRGYVAMANRYLQSGPKLGECWSDAADDPIKTALVQLGADSGIEIDHIVPKTRGGSNAFSNAQVTSRKYNGAKNNNVM